MKFKILFLLQLLAVNFLTAQNYTIPLWNDSIPNYINTGATEIIDTFDLLAIKKVQNPDIAVYLPSPRSATGEAVIICPGGGYGVVVYDWEGTDIAKALNGKGIAAIVLKYRLPTPENSIIQYKSPLIDAQRAMRMVRYNAPKWNIKRDKIGIMGFSAGGHLAATLSTHYDNGNINSNDSIEQFSCRPDFSVLVYPVITFDDSFTHLGSKQALLGKNPNSQLVNLFSNEKQVTDDTPPAILFHASDDEAVPVENSIAYYSALSEHKIHAEMHIYPYGKHGFGLAVGKGYLSDWMDRVVDWITYITSERR